MLNAGRRTLAIMLVSALAAVYAHAQSSPPNPYETVEKFFKLPQGRTIGSTPGIAVDHDGSSLWAFDRCGGQYCAGSSVAPILEFDASGTLVKSFGAGMFVRPHGIYVDRDGNLWVTDGEGPDGKDPSKDGKGHQVFKFSPDGKVLLTLGKAGVAGNPPEALTEPNDVVTAPNGDIFVAEGHSGQNANATPDTVARIAKFTKDGKFVKSWGKFGAGPGEFKTPHSLALDSRGRLFVADRGNVRLQLFDQDGKFLTETKDFSRISGLFITKDDTLYAADSESSPTSHPGNWKRGIRIGSAKDLKVQYLIPDGDNPDPAKTTAGTSAAEGVAVDAKGNVYGAEVGPKAVKKYTKGTGTR